jgi:phosphate starvation-inducible PhoH-like protein
MGRRRNAPQTDSQAIYFEPKTEAQQQAFDIYKQNDITFFLGASGSGKSHLAVYCALYDLFSTIRTRKVNKIIVTRPAVESEDTLGSLPGDLTEKINPYMAPLYTCLGKMVTDPDEVIERYIEASPIAYMRGKTFDDCVAILDEAQNCTASQLKLYITRLGTGGKLIITGDEEQSDIGRDSGLAKVVNALQGIKGVGVYRFDVADIVRHPILSKILAKWSK